MERTFNPADWLARFVHVGGAYAFTGDRLHLWIVPRDQTDEELSQARALVIDMGPDNRALLAEHLRATALVEG